MLTVQVSSSQVAALPVSSQTVKADDQTAITAADKSQASSKHATSRLQLILYFLICFLSPPGEAATLLMMTPSPNYSSAEAARCIVNDQMRPFTILYILIFIIGLPGSLLSVWTFIRSPRAKVGPLPTEAGR